MEDKFIFVLGEMYTGKDEYSIVFNAEYTNENGYEGYLVTWEGNDRGKFYSKDNVETALRESYWIIPEEVIAVEQKTAKESTKQS